MLRINTQDSEEEIGNRQSAIGNQKETSTHIGQWSETLKGRATPQRVTFRLRTKIQSACKRSPAPRQVGVPVGNGVVYPRDSSSRRVSIHFLRDRVLKSPSTTVGPSNSPAWSRTTSICSSSPSAAECGSICELNMRIVLDPTLIEAPT